MPFLVVPLIRLLFHFKSNPNLTDPLGCSRKTRHDRRLHAEPSRCSRSGASRLWRQWGIIASSWPDLSLPKFDPRYLVKMMCIPHVFTPLPDAPAECLVYISGRQHSSASPHCFLVFLDERMWPAHTYIWLQLIILAHCWFFPVRVILQDIILRECLTIRTIALRWICIHM